MCLCTKPKQKPDEKLQRPIISSKIPKSTILFDANQYEAKNFTDQNNFVTTKKADAYAVDNLDRDSHYHQQIGNTNKSKLLQPKQFLNYDLDGQDGISKTCMINTFHYQSVLNHCFLNPSESAIRESRQRVSSYENSSPPYGYENRNTNRSSLEETKFINKVS